MARTRELTVTMGATIKMGARSYEFVKVDAGETITLEDGDEREREHRRLVHRVKRRLETEVLELRAVARQRDARDVVAAPREHRTEPDDERRGRRRRRR